MAATELLGVKHRSGTRLRWGVVGALVLLAAIVAVIWRTATERTPPLAMHQKLAAYVRFPGTSPVLEWPREGQAAVEVEGVGSLGTSGSSTPVPIASVAKVMTAYLTLLEHPLGAGEDGFVMTVTPADSEEEEQRESLGESTLQVRVGERITERQALEALLLPSANNVAAMLAFHDAGGLGAFVDRMNAAAKRLRMSSTTYTDPSGFEPSTVSTASDQLKLARAAMRNPTFASLVEESSAELPVAGEVDNYNGLVGEEGYVGVKTGSDRAAGGCLVFAKHTVIDGRTLTVLGVVLGQREGSLIDAALTSARRLGNSVAAALRVQTVIPKGAKVLSAISTGGQRVAIVTKVPLREIGWAGLRLRAEVGVRPAMTELRAGEQVANVTVRGASTSTTGAVANGSLGGPTLGWRLRHLL